MTPPMNYVKEGDKIVMMTEMIPLINIQTGEIIDWKVMRSFRVNMPKKEKVEQKPLQTQFEQEELL